MKRTHIFGLIVLCITVLFLSCAKELSYEKGINKTQPATGTLKDSSDNCMPIIVHGTYYNGIPAGDTNYVTLTINVTSVGSYKIQTDEANGIHFYDSGFFSTTGIDTIHLQAVGTPSLPVATDFAVTFDSSTCGFTLPIKDSTGTGLGNGGNNNNGGDSTNTDSTINISDTAWSFADSLRTYHGPFDSAYFGTITYNNITTDALVLKGVTSPTDDSTFLLGIKAANGSVSTGQYSSKTAAFLELDDANNSIVYAASPLVTQAGYPEEVTVTITSYDALSKIVEGTFSGTVADVSGGSHTINNGKFKARVMN